VVTKKKGTKVKGERKKEFCSRIGYREGGRGEGERGGKRLEEGGEEKGKEGKQ